MGQAMKLIRSWPSRPPEGRARVDDSIERLVMDDYDYHCLGEVGDDVLLLEWDIAVGRAELITFVMSAEANPDRVLVAPYPIYRSTLSLRALGLPVWPMRRYNDGNQSMRWVTPADPTCHTFGFGIIYLPQLLVKRYLADLPDIMFNDTSFSQWHYLNAPDPEVPIAWACAAVHLNYQLPKL